MDKRDKGKRKVIQPIHVKHNTSSMSLSSEEDNKMTGNKLMQSAINSQKPQSEKIHSYQQCNPIMDVQFLNKFNPAKVKQWNLNSSESTRKDSQTSIITFGKCPLPKCYDMNKKFRPMIGMELIEEQQCLLDNL